jgi:hypothetical protein
MAGCSKKKRTGNRNSVELSAGLELHIDLTSLWQASERKLERKGESSTLSELYICMLCETLFALLLN